MKLLGKISVITIFTLFISINAFSTNGYKKTTINGTECYIYYVQPGEGFYSISKKFATTRDDVVKFNPETKNGLNKGQKLYIPISNTTEGSNGKTVEEPIRHIVKQGESLYSISKQYNISINEIKTLNKLNSNSIKVGQVLTVGSSKAEEQIVKNETVIKDEIGQQEEDIITETEVKSNPIPENKVVIDGVTYNTEKYVVKKRETLYSISQKFNTTVDAIIACNTNLKSLKKDDILNIPMTREVLNVVDEYEAENKHVIINNENTNESSSKEINIAVILPFKLSTLGGQSPYSDYYKGLLLALDSLKNNGLNANIYTYDTNGNADNIYAILKQPEMQNVNIIFGSDKNEEIKILGEFAKEKKIYLVNSFSVKNREYQNNPYIIQGHIPSASFFATASKHLIETTAYKEIIFLYDNQEKNDKQEFVDAICEGLKLNGKEYKKFSFNDITDYEVLNESIESNSDIILIASSSTKSGVAKTCAIATRIKDSNPTVSVSIFGYPEWQTYIKDYMDTFHSLNTTIFTRFYSQPTKANWKNFNKKFRYWFGEEKSSILPTPNILGYDTGIYLINGLLRHSNNFEQYLETIESQSIQTDFSFNRIADGSGFVNTNLYFVTFTPEYKIVKEKVK